MRGQAHNEDIKAQVLAALLAGQSVTQVAQQYKLSKSVVSTWKNGLSESEIEQVRTEKNARVDTLIFEYLSANLTALKKQAEVASDTEYIKKQSAESLAVLHGVMSDKAIRILEAAGQAERIETPS